MTVFETWELSIVRLADSRNSIFIFYLSILSSLPVSGPSFSCNSLLLAFPLLLFHLHPLPLNLLIEHLSHFLQLWPLVPLELLPIILFPPQPLIFISRRMVARHFSLLVTSAFGCSSAVPRSRSATILAFLALHFSHSPQEPSKFPRNGPLFLQPFPLQVLWK
jgi:hypothetical protein